MKHLTLLLVLSGLICVPLMGAGTNEVAAALQRLEELNRELEDLKAKAQLVNQALAGNAEAQCALGNYYYLGKGGPKDYAQAYAWFDIAAAQGNQNAAGRRSKILKEILPEQIAKGKRLSREYTAASVQQGSGRPAADHRDASQTARIQPGAAPASSAPARFDPLPSAAPVAQAPDKSSPLSPAAPPAALKQGNRFADPSFRGFPSGDPCDREYWTMRGVPWKVAAEAGAGKTASAVAIPVNLPAFSSEAYQGLVGRSKEAIGMVYGPMNEPESRSFELLWAPFFDHQNAPCFDYFGRLLPLLDEYHRINAEATGLEQGLREDMDDAGMRALAGDELGARTMLDSSYRHVVALRDGKQALGRTLAKIQALGDPPNPLQEKCQARKQHRDVMKNVRNLGIQPITVGTWVFTKRWSKIEKPTFRDTVELDRAGDKLMWGSLEVKSPNTLFLKQYSVRREGYGKDYKCWRVGNVQDTFSWTIPDTFKPGQELGIVLSVAARVEGEVFQFKTGGGVYCKIWEGRTDVSNHLAGTYATDLTRCDSVSAGVGTCQAKKTFVDVLDHSSLACKGSGEGDQMLVMITCGPDSSAQQVYYIDPSFSYLYTYTLQDPTAILAKNKQDQDAADKQAAQPSYQPAQEDTAKKADLPPLVPDLAEETREATAQHLSVMKIIKGNLPSLEKDLAAAKAALQGRPPTKGEADRIGQLSENLAVQQANLQSEADIVSSLETGVVVKTRTAWDEREHQRFVARIQDEVGQLALESRLVAGLPNYGNLVQGPEGVETRAWVQKNLAEAVKSKDRVGQLQKIASVIGTRIEAQQFREQAQAQDWAAQAQLGLSVSETVKGAADGAMLIGSLLFPPAGAVAIWYGVGVGAVEGGPSKAFENGVRAYSDKVDVIWASYEGYYGKDEKGQPRGWLGAADNAATAFLMNKFMAKAGESLHGGSLPKHTPNDVPKTPTSKPKALPVFDAYKDGNERLAEDLAGLNKKFGAADPARNPEYAKALETVNQKHEIIIKRQALEQDLSAITAKYEAKIPQEARNADRSVKTDHPEYQKIKAAWEGEMKAAWDQHNVGYEGRMKQHLSAVDSAGLKFVETSSTDPNWDLRMSGGNPKSIKSDIDMAAHTLAGGQKFARTMSDQGHNVIEYPDRWVITSTDTTVWKPKEATSTFPIKIGSAEHEAQVALDTWRGSDKFPTEGGVQYTTGKGIYDPKGAVIANLKKASEAGIGGHSSGPDFHVIGKSMVKATEIANQTGTGAKINEPDFMAKAQGVQQHQTPEQAGLVTFGNSPAAKQREADAWLAKARDLIKRSYDSSAETSRKVEAQYGKDLKVAIAANDRAQQQQIRETLVRIRVSNESALRTIAGFDPKLVKGLIQGDLTLDVKNLTLIPAPAPEGGGGFGWLWSPFREEVHGAPPVPEPTVVSTPDLQVLSTRCGQAAKEIETHLLPKLKKDGPEAAHLRTLKTMFEQGRNDPIKALRNARFVTGYELATVLKEVEPPVKK